MTSRTTAHIVDRPEWLPEHPSGNPVALTDDTPLRLIVGPDQFLTTAGAFFGDNDDDAFDRAGIFAALSRGEAFRGGGGASPEWCVEVVL